MKRERFNELMQGVFKKVEEKEREKQAEYVPAEEDDRLAHFKEVGAITGEPAHQALRGMMVKHTKSIYDMLKALDTNKYELHKWQEKMHDHIIYLILLEGLIQERYEANVKNISRSADRDYQEDFFAKSRRPVRSTPYSEESIKLSGHSDG